VRRPRGGAPGSRLPDPGQGAPGRPWWEGPSELPNSHHGPRRFRRLWGRLESLDAPLGLYTTGKSFFLSCHYPSPETSQCDLHLSLSVLIGLEVNEGSNPQGGSELGSPTSSGRNRDQEVLLALRSLCPSGV
jgi:hypothetical protein